MIYNNLFLDYNYKKTFDLIAIREGWIDKREEGDSLLECDKVKRRIPNKSTVLLMMTLFDKIDMDFSEYNLSKFVDEGIILPNATTFDHSQGLLGPYPYDSERVNYYTKKQIEFAHKLTFQILRKEKQWFVKRLFQNYKYDEINRYKRDFIPNPKIVLSEMDTFINSYEKDEIIDHNSNRSNFYNYIEEELSFVSTPIIRGILHSINNTSTFATTLQITNNFKLHKDSIINIKEDIGVLAKINLQNEIKFFPAPQTISDVIELRQRKEIKRFREVVADWFNTIQNGDTIIESKIRNDISKANKELKKLSKYREINNSPFYFWIYSIGGHIPILSNILTGIYTLSGIYEKITEKKYNWTLLTK